MEGEKYMTEAAAELTREIAEILEKPVDGFTKEEIAARKKPFRDAASMFMRQRDEATARATEWKDAAGKILDLWLKQLEEETRRYREAKEIYMGVFRKDTEDAVTRQAKES
jgi:hypothetical protein